MLKYFLVLALCLSTCAHAIPTEKWAHMGLSFAATTVSYGVCKKLFQMKNQDARRWRCILAAALITGVAGGIKEATDPTNDRDDILANGAGIGAAGLSIVVFDF